MNLILSTILQEKERIDRMLVKYQEELGVLPKGTVSEKKRLEWEIRAKRKGLPSAIHRRQALSAA